MLLIGMPKHLTTMRQASHKLNKKQFKKNCGYKEISAKPIPIMPVSVKPIMAVTKVMTARDKDFVNHIKPIIPKFTGKVYKAVNKRDKNLIFDGKPVKPKNTMLNTNERYILRLNTTIKI